MSTPSRELIVCRPEASHRTGMDNRDATSTRAATPMRPVPAEIPLSMGRPEEADGGTRTPDPIITSVSGVSLVGVSGEPIAVDSGVLGAAEDGAGRVKRPKNAPT
jgi:hypothetical protein